MWRFSSILECYFTFRPRFFTFHSPLFIAHCLLFTFHLSIGSWPLASLVFQFSISNSFFILTPSCRCRTVMGYPPSIELNLNSIFSGRESDATQSCNSIELNHFWWYRNALKAQYRLSPCPGPPLTLPRGNYRVSIGYRLDNDWRKVEPTEINHRI